MEDAIAKEMLNAMENGIGDRILARSKAKEGRLTPAGLRLLEDYESHTAAAEEQVRRRFMNPILTVDGLLLLRDGIVLVRRGREPYKGSYALPGGIVEYGETVEGAIKREVLEETGLRTEAVRLLGAYSDPDRDPRGHFITLAFELRRTGGRLRSGDDAAEALVRPLDDLPDLAFDHGRILNDFLEARARDLKPVPSERAGPRPAKGRGPAARNH